MSNIVTIACLIPRCVDEGNDQVERGIRFTAERIGSDVFLLADVDTTLAEAMIDAGLAYDYVRPAAENDS